ncbi:MAG: hypothetical protein HY751_00805 [Nitrospinae bacterium]|nr:hypothetical protein [Nitrospinota bacterium]
MKKTILTILALLIAPVMAFALPGSSVYPNAKAGNEFGPVPCAGCHKSNGDFEKNIYVDVRDNKGASLINKEGVAEIPFKAGETTELEVVVGLKDQDKKAKLAGWFVNVPQGASLAHGSVNYCYQRLNYEVPPQFTADKKPYRTFDKHSISFPKYFAPTETELWVGVGGKATDLEPGSDGRKGTMGLKTIKLKWVKDTLN